VIPVLTHRQTTASSVTAEDRSGVDEVKHKKEKKERKRKDDKEPKKEKKRSSEPSSDHHVFDGDLLGIGGPPPASTAVTSDRQQAVSVEPKHKSGSRSKNEKDKQEMHLWSPITLPGLTKPKVYYLATNNGSASDVVDVVFVVVNDDDSNVSVSIDFPPGAVISVLNYDGKLVRDGSGRDYLILCQNLKASKSEVSGSAKLRLCTPISDAAIQLPCNIRIQTDSLLGASDSCLIQSSIVVSACVGLTEYKMSEDDYETLLVDRARSKMKYCGTASEHIAIDTRLTEDPGSKRILKAIVNFTNSYVVSKESSKAIAATCRASGDSVVCFLIKILSHTEESAAVLLDVKYFSNDGSIDTNSRARGIVSSLRNLVLM
jgi:hypothetical protein